KKTNYVKTLKKEYLKALNKIRNSYPVTPDEAEFYVTKCLMLFGDLSPEHLQTVLKDLNAKMAGISEDKK
ncbi:hypothetical protein R5Q17_00005, partial [Oenococcus oeni]